MYGILLFAPLKIHITIVLKCIDTVVANNSVRLLNKAKSKLAIMNFENLEIAWIS